MYGLVNQAVRDLVVQLKGEEQWRAICRSLDISHHDFVALQSYPDELTYALVGEVSRTLQIPADQVLRAFGRHWVKYTAGQGHKDSFEMFPRGREGMISFLEGLDDMHGRIMMAMPELCPPQVSCNLVSPELLHVYYSSERQDLGPMMIGLLEGLLEWFAVEGDVSQAKDAHPEVSAQHVFEIALRG